MPSNVCDGLPIMQLEPLKTEDIPAREKPFWKMTGPGAVLVGLAIGAGEIVVWPRVVAEYGATMVWGAVIGVFIQLWINFEIGRYVIATGESVYTGFSRVWKGFGLAFIFFNIAGWILPAWARVSGNAMKALLLGPTHDSPDWFWTAVTFAIVAALLFGPKRVYATVEKVISLLVLLIVLGLTFIAIRVGTWDTYKELFAGIINFGHIEEGYSGKEFFSALVFAGAGGTANLFYAFYLRDKHIGMGARMPALLNPFRAREEKEVQTGYTFPETPENVRRFKDWFRYVILDQTLYFWILNTFTILLFVFGALAVLHPKGIVPAAGSLIWDESQILSETMGKPGQILFLLIGLATLFSTQITLTDGVARSIADILHTNYAWARRIPSAKIYFFGAMFIIVSGVGITWYMETSGVTELGFLFNAGYVGGFAMAVYAPLIIYLNITRLPKSARPKLLNIIMASMSALVYMGFAAYCIWWEITSRLN